MKSPHSILVAFALGLSNQGLLAADLPKPVLPFLDQHCVECHDSDVSKGDLNLADLHFDPEQPDNFAVWQRVYERVRDGEMPPEKKPQPAKADANQFIAELGAPLLKADRADIADNGRVQGRRLTRVEYEYTVHDLLGIDIPLKELLPEDSSSMGFETVAKSQQLSQHQLARYLDVADLALDAAFSRVIDGDASFHKQYSPELMASIPRGNYRGPDFRHGESITWPITLQFFGKLHVTTVPEDGWYRVTVRGVRAINPGADGAVWGTLRSGACSSSAPMLYMIGLVEATLKPKDLVYEAWIQKGHMLELKPNDAELRRAPTGAKGGNVSFVGRDLEKDGFSGIANKGVEIERIYPMATRKFVRQRLFGDRVLKDIGAGDKAATLDKLVAEFATRAFRRPVTEEQLAPYREIGRQSLVDGDTLLESLRASYRAILCSPRFFTFVEKPGLLDDHAIASRLSYALWISMPDAELIQLAAKGSLHQPEVLQSQIERMLSDSKSDRFVHSFTDQWLKLKQIDFTSPDSRQFRTFDPVLQESMVQETRAYVAEIIQKNLGIANLVDSDFTYLNGRLARHYGLEEPLTPGAGLKKVSFTPNKNKVRGGLLTQGAVLKVTADGTHTSPVVRGVFINERILGQHIPPPPPGVPAIEPDIRGATTIREQLEKHRSNTSCASCHMTIDPPGFALENFDPIGSWRVRYGTGRKSPVVNPTGVTPDGAAFADLAEWKKIYSHRTDQLARGFAQQFLTYATGAKMRFSDGPEIEKVIKQTGKSGHGLRSILTTSLMSPIFLRK